MAEIVYILCVLTSGAVAMLLLKGYWASRLRLLLWTGLGFVGLCINNIMLMVDVMYLHDADLSLQRLIPAVVGMALLVFGLIWEGSR